MGEHLPHSRRYLLVGPETKIWGEGSLPASLPCWDCVYSVVTLATATVLAAISFFSFHHGLKTSGAPGILQARIARLELLRGLA